MASLLPSRTLRCTQLPTLFKPSASSQTRNASLLNRPHRPYTFTQLIALSDGSTFTVRTTSPAAVHRSTQDSRNHPMWQPSLDNLRNVEKDEAGRLRAFRERFGRGWDAEGMVEEEEEEEGTGEALKADGGKGKDGISHKKGGEDEGDSLFDLISGAASGKKS